MNRRIQKINKLLARELAKIIQEDFTEKLGIITINSVNTSSDLANAQIYISVYPNKTIDTNTIIKTINQNVFSYRKDLYKKLSFKTIPEFKFILDESIDKINKIEEILHKIENEK